MTSEDFYCGFFLANSSIEDNNTGSYVLKVACFKPSTTFRRVLQLRVEKEYNFDYGQLIHFYPSDGNLEQNSLVFIREDVSSFYEHVKTKPNLIIHAMKNVAVSAENIPSCHEYKHPDLGSMKDGDDKVKPGNMLILFEVIVNDDTFDLEVFHAAEQQENGTPTEQTISPREKFENIHEIIKIEHDHNKKAETEIWGRIGNLRLYGFSETSIKGVRPIFELLDDEKSDIFNKQKKNSEVVIIKLKEVNGELVDDNEQEIQFGTLVESQEDIGHRYVMAQLKSEYRHKFERKFKCGDLFRFESALTEKTGKFWEKQKQMNSELFEHTLYWSTEEEVKEMQLADVVDDFSKIDIGDIKDRGTQRDQLNASQYNAIKMALNEKRKVVCIQGPPGTGKTYVLAHLLATLMFKKKQAIILTPTKEALRNIIAMTEKVLKERNISYHDKSLMDISKFDKAVEDSPAAKDGLKRIAQWKKEYIAGNLKEEDFDSMRKNLINLTFAEAGTETMKQASFVFATMQSSFIVKVMRYRMFDPCMCVIDEAAQVMETQTWPAVKKMKRIVMAGDPKQLPALVISPEGKAAKLEESIMDRIIHNKEKFSWIMLDEQYRCHPAISVWSNKSFYDRALQDKTNPNNTIHMDLKPKAPKDFRTLFDPFVFVDTSAETTEKRTVMYEKVSDESFSNKEGKMPKSYKNEGEAMLVLTHYLHLRELSIKAENIAIITPYRGQTELIRNGMNNIINKTNDTSCRLTTIGTVDSVQGKEYDCVIFSMVRSNPKKTLGFVCDLRRLNVIVTRAKRHFMFIGNGYMMANSYVKEIRDLIFEFISSRHRFHPDHVGYTPTPLNSEVKNNFGYNFEAFVSYTNDTEMKDWCAAYVQKQNDPEFRRKQEERKARKAQLKARENDNK